MPKLTLDSFMGKRIIFEPDGAKQGARGHIVAISSAGIEVERDGMNERETILAYQITQIEGGIFDGMRLFTQDEASALSLLMLRGER